MLRLFSIVAMLSIATPLHAEETLQDCAAVRENDARLKCYDRLAETQVSKVEIKPTQSKWVVRTEASPVDDSTNVYMSVAGENGILNQYGQSSELTLMLRCRENVTSAIFVFGGHFMSDTNGSGRVTYRLDKTPAQSRNFDESTDHEALGLWNGGSSIPWIKSLFGGERLYVQATPYSESAVSDFLPVAGLEEAIMPLRKACGW